MQSEQMILQTGIIRPHFPYHTLFFIENVNCYHSAPKSCWKRIISKKIRVFIVLKHSSQKTDTSPWDSTTHSFESVVQSMVNVLLSTTVACI